VGIISQVLDGLGYAHEKGIVHRDLKPSNILLVRMGSNLTALIADFGLAKNFQRAGLSGMTMSGACSGTLPFMPPEQVVNFRDVKPVADIFSAGATLYVMLTGQCVYDFKEGEDQVRALLEKRIVPIRKRRVKLPEKLMDVVDRATQAEPEKRFQSVKEMKAALKKAMCPVPK
jgi:serine/threonine-protein kinase